MMKFTGKRRTQANLAWQAYIAWLMCPEQCSDCSSSTKHAKMRTALIAFDQVIAQQTKADLVKRVIEADDLPRRY